MIPYDAKLTQKCKICGFEFNHNKQGRFTSHLIKNHNLNLEEYLINYHYKPQDLKCVYELCNQTVKLYRGIPNRYCSKSCGSKGKPLICIICNSKFDTSTRPHRKTKTCSHSCEKVLRSNKTMNWHQSMSEKEKISHFKNIITKTARTRRKNGTPSWNSGKKVFILRKQSKKFEKQHSCKWKIKFLKKLG